MTVNSSGMSFKTAVHPVELDGREVFEISVELGGFTLKAGGENLIRQIAGSISGIDRTDFRSDSLVIVHLTPGETAVTAERARNTLNHLLEDELRCLSATQKRESFVIGTPAPVKAKKTKAKTKA